MLCALLLSYVALEFCTQMTLCSMVLLFSAVSIIDDVCAEIIISSYVDDPFAFMSSFLIRKFLLSKMITIMIRKTVTALTIIKITIKIVAVKVTATPLLPWLSEAESNVFCNN